LALPFVLYKKVILLAQEADGVRERALSLFAGRAKRTLGLAGEVCIRVTSDREIRQLNRRHRRKDKPTDVLSFPSSLAEQAGDIAISADTAAKNAAALGHSVETELKILVLHGLLHLAGYDHEKDRGEMEACELKLRQQFKLPLGLIERAHSAVSQTAKSSLHAPRRRRGKAVR